MAFITHLPITKQFEIKTTTQPVYKQLLHELEILKFKTGGAAPAPYIEQGKFYYTDATALNWRSGGLLYYYCFLNFAKALLINNSVFDGVTIRGEHVDHGLSCPKQTVTNFLDLKISIKPVSGRNNVFALLFKQVCKSDWPFQNIQTVTVRDLLPYIHDISSEIKELYMIPKAGEVVYSIIRSESDRCWFELITTPTAANSIISSLPNGEATLISFENLTFADKAEWHASHGFTAPLLNGSSLVRLKIYSVSNTATRDECLKNCVRDSVNLFNKLAYPSSVIDEMRPAWAFFPRFKIENLELEWHSLFSNYLFAFALGSVLRYRPYLLQQNSPEYFLAEAWTMQAPTSVLREFVLNHNEMGVIIQPT